MTHLPRPDPLDRFAPWPQHEADVTADALIRHAAVHAHGALTLADAVPRKAPRQLERALRYVVTAELLREVGDLVIEPTHADVIARRLWRRFGDGADLPAAMGEWLGDLGLNPDEIARAAIEVYEARAAELDHLRLMHPDEDRRPGTSALDSIELRRLADQIESEQCTGVAAQWCPLHGTCSCPRDDEGAPVDGLDSPSCPLHASTSSHAAARLAEIFDPKAEPSSADDPWAGMDLGTYVHRQTEQHVCPLPAEWIRGAVWRCPDGHLWTVDTACGTCKWLGRGEGGARHVHTVGYAWWPATRWQRIRARWTTGQPILRAAVGMANGNRIQDSPKPAPPLGPGGVWSDVED